MNDLSWFIYLADVLESIKALFMIIGIVGFVIATAILCSTYGYDRNESWNRKLLYIAFPVCFLAVLVGCFVPSSDTMYAIAASEMGEKVVNNPIAGKAVKALDAWLDEQIADISKDDKK